MAGAGRSPANASFQAGSGLQRISINLTIQQIAQFFDLTGTMSSIFA